MAHFECAACGEQADFSYQPDRCATCGGDMARRPAVYTPVAALPYSTVRAASVIALWHTGKPLTEEQNADLQALMHQNRVAMMMDAFSRPGCAAA